MKPFELHIDYSAKDNDKCYTLHAIGCKHRSRGNVRVVPVTGMSDPFVQEALSLDWRVSVSPCVKKP